MFHADVVQHVDGVRWFLLQILIHASFHDFVKRCTCYFILFLSPSSLYPCLSFFFQSVSFSRSQSFPLHSSLSSYFPFSSVLTYCTVFSLSFNVSIFLSFSISKRWFCHFSLLPRQVPIATGILGNLFFTRSPAKSRCREILPLFPSVCVCVRER